MLIVAAGPALVALGALTGLGRSARLGTFVSLGSAAAFADIASRRSCPGANDNLSGVAVVLELARALRERPVARRARPAGLHGLGGVVHGGHARVRAAATSRALPPERTEFVCLDSVGSPS